MKKCNGPCNQEKEDTEFHVKRYNNGTMGLRALCKACGKAARDEYRRVSPKDNERNKAYNKRNAVSLRGKKLVKYWPGSTWQEALAKWEALFEKQGRHCALCPKAVGLHVDHHHGTGVVRGLLCNKCNRGIGMLGDNIENLQEAITYLLVHEI